MKLQKEVQKWLDWAEKYLASLEDQEKKEGEKING
jgi:hypothetical protein